MKKNQFYVLFILLMAITQVSAQSVNDKLLLGKWLTKDDSVMEFITTGNNISVKQISTKNEKDRKDNEKILGKGITFSEEREFKGIMINPKNNKEYNSVFIVSDDGKKLLLKVKWGFVNFKEDWVKIQ